MKKDTRSANVRSPRPVRTSPVNTPDELKTMLDNVATNPAKVEFPRDTWGFTSAFKKAAMNAAGDIKGQQDKHDLFMATLAVIAKHVEARFEVDKNFKKDLSAQKLTAYTERASRQRVFGITKPNLVNPLEQEPKVNG